MPDNDNCSFVPSHQFADSTLFSSTLHMLQCVEVKTEPESADERDGDKSAAFTVLLHGSLKVEQMIALVQLGSVFTAL